MPHVEQELLILLEHLGSSLVFCGILVARYLIFLSFVDLQILITPLASSNSSDNIHFFFLFLFLIKYQNVGFFQDQQLHMVCILTFLLTFVFSFIRNKEIL